MTNKQQGNLQYGVSMFFVQFWGLKRLVRSAEEREKQRLGRRKTEEKLIQATREFAAYSVDVLCVDFWLQRLVFRSVKEKARQCLGKRATDDKLIQAKRELSRLRCLCNLCSFQLNRHAFRSAEQEWTAQWLGKRRTVRKMTSRQEGSLFHSACKLFR